MALLVPALGGASSGAQEAASAAGPGFGQAVGQIVRIDPVHGGLSAGAEFGIAKASHQNRSSLATSRVIDPGLTGLILAAEGCDGGAPSWPAEQQPQAIRADSDDEQAAEASDTGFRRRVSATDQPLAHGEILSEATSLPGLLGVGSSRAIADSGLVGEGVREAVASVEIDAVDLLGGLVRLSHLRWQSRHRGGAEDVRDGAFTVEAIEVGGTPVPVDDLGAAFEAVNAVIAPFGIRLGVPTVHESGGVLFVDPLAVIIEPSPQRDAVFGALVRTAQPGREVLFDLLFQIACDFEGLVTVLDVVAGSATGAGRLSIELGGTEATTEAIEAPPRLVAPVAGNAVAAPEAGAGAGASRAPVVPSSPGAVSAPIAPAVPAAGGASAPAAAAGSGTPITVVPVSDPDRDLALLVGLGTLLFGVLLVLADARTMRRAGAAAAAVAGGAG